MKKIFFSPVFLEIFLIFILSLTPLLWFRPGMVMVGHDLVAPLDLKVFFAGRLSTWIDQFFGQSQALILGTIPIHFIDVIPSYLGFSVEAGQKIVYVLWFFLIGLSAYVLAQTINSKSSIFKILSVILYQFNYFLLQGWFIGEKSKFSAYIALPMILSLILRVRNGLLSPIRAAAITSIILFVFNGGGLYGISLFGGALVVWGSFLFLIVLERIYSKKIRQIRPLLVYIFFSVFLTVCVNAYFVLPSIIQFRQSLEVGTAQVGGVSGLISWANEISANTSFINLFRLQGIPDWYDNPEHPYAKQILTNPLFIVVSFIFPMTILLSVLLVKERKKKKLVLLFFFSYLLGIFFIAGTHAPFGFIYELLIRFVPGFIAFRTPYYKFAPALFLSSAFIIALSIDSLSKRLKRILFLFICLIVLLYHFPFFTGNFVEWRRGYSTRLTVPSYVFDFGRWINNNPNSRVVLAPPNNPDLRYSMYTWGYLSFQSLPTLLTNASVIVNNDRLNTEEQTLLLVFYKAILDGKSVEIERLARLLGITHVLLTRDVMADTKSPIPLETEKYAEGIIQSHNFKEVARWGSWELYEVLDNSYQPLVGFRHVPMVDAKLQDISDIFDHETVQSSFVLSKDIGGKKTEFDQGLEVADCLNCLKSQPHRLTFPDPRILPGDPFYGFVQFSERRNSIGITDPKSAIYDDLGITLKRVAEINLLIYRQIPLTEEEVAAYSLVLETIQHNFNRLGNLKDKVSVAKDIQQYMKEERDYLRPNIGRYLSSGPQTVFAGKIFTQIQRLDDMAASFFSPIESKNIALYQFTVPKHGVYKLVLRSSDLKKVFQENANGILFSIDDRSWERMVIDENTDAWIRIISSELSSGLHTLKLTLPNLPISNQTFSPIITEYSAAGENSCFGSTTSNVTGDYYRMRLNYLNDFSESLLFFVWEKKSETRELVIANRLPASGLKDKLEIIVPVSSNRQQLEFALCAPNLTLQRATSQFDLSIVQDVSPVVIVEPADNITKQETFSISFKKDSSTRYRFTLSNSVQFPVVISLSSRFDPWWTLSGTPSTHIRMNGFSNGWVVENAPKDKELTIEYKGQDVFLYGVTITIISLFMSGLLSLRRPS